MANKNMAWLEEVKADARHITLKRIQEDKADREYQESKQSLPVREDEPALEEASEPEAVEAEAEAAEEPAPKEARKSKKGNK